MSDPSYFSPPRRGANASSFSATTLLQMPRGASSASGVEASPTASTASWRPASTSASGATRAAQHHRIHNHSSASPLVGSPGTNAANGLESSGSSSAYSPRVYPRPPSESPTRSSKQGFNKNKGGSGGGERTGTTPSTPTKITSLPSPRKAALSPSRTRNLTTRTGRPGKVTGSRGFYWTIPLIRRRVRIRLWTIVVGLVVLVGWWKWGNGGSGLDGIGRDSSDEGDSFESNGGLRGKLNGVSEIFRNEGGGRGLKKQIKRKAFTKGNRGGKVGGQVHRAQQEEDEEGSDDDDKLVEEGQDAPPQTSGRPNRRNSQERERATKKRVGTTKDGPPSGRRASSAPKRLALQEWSTDTCQTCMVDPRDPLCVYGVDNIRLSRGYEGSGVRIRKMLSKALKGEVVRIGLIGGKISAGQGLGDKSSWFEIFSRDFQKTFPRSQFIDGSKGSSVPTAYHSYCHSASLPRDLDLYFVELDIGNGSLGSTLEEEDTLYRSLLLLPQAPAMIRVSTFDLSDTDTTTSLASALLTSRHFDVPLITVREILQSRIFSWTSSASQWFAKASDGVSTDWGVMNPKAHQVLGDVVALYVREMACETKRRQGMPKEMLEVNENEWPTQGVVGIVPRAKIWDSHSSLDNPSYEPTPFSPHCMFGNSLYAPLVHFPDPSLTTREAWQADMWDDQAGYVSSTVDSLISFSFTGSQVGLFYWQTDGIHHGVKVALQQPGRARCWVDDEALAEGAGKSVQIEAFGQERQGSRVAWMPVVGKGDGLTFAEHTVSCRIVQPSSTEGHVVRILGVASQ
ncbi:BQ5605_C025g10012 [Microbotryum silenes-dioicae]|uniref:BQ5605_C025g10012 protein n=1 Tax=Microbotryum silenes-dioicae TaxID=796604 RepID=A0A2X0PLN5_9BASI|nr:BQ5605_C025g10012 [Microbotryum silenes-dioicae]